MIRNVLPLSVWINRLRGSFFEREVLGADVYPTNVEMRDGNLVLEFDFRRGRSVAETFILLMSGKVIYYGKVSYLDAEEDVLSEAEFVNGVLERCLNPEFELVVEDYAFSEETVGAILSNLYRW